MPYTMHSCRPRTTGDAGSTCHRVGGRPCTDSRRCWQPQPRCMSVYTLLSVLWLLAHVLMINPACVLRSCHPCVSAGAAFCIVSVRRSSSCLTLSFYIPCALFPRHACSVIYCAVTCETVSGPECVSVTIEGSEGHTKCHGRTGQ